MILQVTLEAEESISPIKKTEMTKDNKFPNKGFSCSVVLPNGSTSANYRYRL